MLILIAAFFGGGFYFYNHRSVLQSTSPASGATVVATATPVQIPRVGIQIGHLDADKLPEELSKLQWNFGSQDGDYTELDTVTKIAKLVKQYLEDEGVAVDLLPATVPEGYVADVFVSIHADGNEYSYVSGYKVAGSSFDITGASEKLSDFIDAAYEEATLMDHDGNITTDMTEYYAFNNTKYTHSISAKTAGAIVETGYITNSSDRKIIVSKPSLPAKGIADGILAYLKTKSYAAWPK